MGVVGGSGTGKSVLLRTIVGLQAAGRAAASRCSGATCCTLSDAERRELEQRWGVLFQDGALFSSLTVDAEHRSAAARALPRCRSR